MDPESRKQWQLDNPGTDVLSLELLSNFLDTRSRALESGGTMVTPQSSVTSPCNQGNPVLTKRVQNYAVQGSSCESYQEDHRLYVCSQFKGMCLADRHKFGKHKNLSFNFFQSGHSSNACPSKFTRRECKMKHHTLLQRPQKQLPDQRTSTKTHSSMNSTSNKMETTTQLTTGHSSVDNGINTVGRRDQAAGCLRFRFTSQFHNKRMLQRRSSRQLSAAKSMFLQWVLPISKKLEASCQ